MRGATAFGIAAGARIASADVYGSDPAGGNATAIAKALGWLVERRVSVRRSAWSAPPIRCSHASSRGAEAGLIIVAAVGNNGPAAPPAYPASYPGVIAVTGVDGRDVR